MKSNDDGNADDPTHLSLGGIYPEAPQHAVPEPLPVTEFNSWHLPRKQWVRRKQWADTAAALIDSIGPLDRPLRYLGLPGTELLDLEVLAELCIGKKTRLKYMGFNSGIQTLGDKTTQRLAEQALRDLNVIEQPSVVLPDDIVTLGSATSVATKRMKQFESFDVVNLDFCDVFSGSKGNTRHTAVKNIVEFQMHRRSQPWLLFLTTATAPDAFDGADLTEYQKLFRSNSSISVDFKNKMSEPTLVGPAFESKDFFSALVGARLGRVLTVGIGKWLLALVASTKGWKVELKSCVGYRRGLLNIKTNSKAIHEPDLFSLVFGFGRIQEPLLDPTGLAKVSAKAQKEGWNRIESRAAMQIATRASKSLDLDFIMGESIATTNEMLEDSIRLLALRNYDIPAYRKWAASAPNLSLPAT